MYILNQLKQTSSLNISTIFKHFWVLNNNNHIYTTFGNEYVQDRFVTNSFQTLDNKLRNHFTNAAFNNNIQLNFNNLYVGVHYKFRTGIFTFKQGIYLNQYHWKVNNNLRDKLFLLPDFSSEIEFSNAEQIHINYALKSTFSNISNLADKYYLLSYNSIFKGNSLLEDELEHTASIRYNKFSLYRGIMLFATLSYAKKAKGIKNTVRFNNKNQFLIPEIINNPEESIRFMFTIRKKIKNIEYKLRGNASYLEFLQKINTTTTTNNSKQFNYTTSIKTLYNKFPTLELGFRQRLGKYTSSQIKSTFATYEPFASVNYSFLKDYTFSFDYNYYNYKNKTLYQKNSY